MQRSRLLRVSLLLLSLIFLAAQAPKPLPLEKTMRENRWKKRVLLVAAPNAANADFQKQKQLLAPEQTQLADRDFLVVEVFYDRLTTADQQFLTQKIGLNPAAFAAVLIGKDGGVKEQSAAPITPESLFGTVDKMPMRRAEMQRTNASRKH